MKKRSELPKDFRRSVEIRSEDVDEKARTVAVSFSSQTDNVRYYGMPEILLHEKGAADFRTLRDAGSVLFNHNPDVILGRPLDVSLDEKDHKGRAVIQFDDDPVADGIFKKVRSKSVRGVSVGFRVDEWQVLDEKQSWTSPSGQQFRGPAYIATKWRAHEFSITPIPADSTVGVGRTQGLTEPGEWTMNIQKLRETLAKRGGLKADATDEEILAAAEEQLRVSVTAVVSIDDDEDGPSDGDGEAEAPAKRKDAPSAPSTEAATREGARAERMRSKEIREICGIFDETRSLADGLVDSGASVEAARKACLEAMGKARPALSSPRRVEVGEESATKWRVAAEDRLALRTGWGKLEVEKDPKRLAAAREIEAVTLVELARGCLKRHNDYAPLMTPDTIVKRAMSHSSSDFPNLLSNVANKALQAGYTEAPATWKLFATVVSLSDFKAKTIVGLSDAGDLILTRELEPMPETSFAEKAESYSLKTFSRRFGLSRQAIINDDLSAFDRIPKLMGQAAARVPAKRFYDLLASASGVGPTMAEDALPLFSTTHTSGANYTAGAGAITLTTLSEAKRLLRMQKALVASGEDAPVLNLTPQYLLVPAALETVALQYVSQIVAALNANVQPDWIRGLQVITEPRLDGMTNGTTAWYMVVPKTQLSTVEVAFLDGKEAPTLERVEGNNILGVEWSVYLDCEAKFVDHRGWYRCRGA